MRWVTKHGKNHLRSILADDQFPNGVINIAGAPLEIWINYTSRALNLSVMNAPKDQYYYWEQDRTILYDDYLYIPIQSDRKNEFHVNRNFSSTYIQTNVRNRHHFFISDSIAARPQSIACFFLFQMRCEVMAKQKPHLDWNLVYQNGRFVFWRVAINLRLIITEILWMVVVVLVLQQSNGCWWWLGCLLRRRGAVSVREFSTTAVVVFEIMHWVINS